MTIKKTFMFKNQLCNGKQTPEKLNSKLLIRAIIKSKNYAYRARPKNTMDWSLLVNQDLKVFYAALRKYIPSFAGTSTYRLPKSVPLWPFAENEYDFTSNVLLLKHQRQTDPVLIIKSKALFVIYAVISM